LIEFPLRQEKSVSFIFRCALIFVDTYAHTLFLNSISFFMEGPDGNARRPDG
jgi:hypothetical protein